MSGSDDERFDFSVDADCVEFYDRDRLMCIMTAAQMLEFQQVLKRAMFEWAKVNNLPLDYALDPEREK